MKSIPSHNAPLKNVLNYFGIDLKNENEVRQIVRRSYMKSHPNKCVKKSPATKNRCQRESVLLSRLLNTPYNQVRNALRKSPTPTPRSTTTTPKPKPKRKTTASQKKTQPPPKASSGRSGMSFGAKLGLLGLAAAGYMVGI